MLIDLHNHSCLSPCGSLDMSPRVLAHCAQNLGIELLALTDHNTAENLPAFATCCEERGLVAIFGLEVSSREEVHVLCLFGILSVALEFGQEIYKTLQSIANKPEKLGDQVIVDAEENILGSLDKHLASGASIFSLEELGQMVHARDGLFIPAHIDRPSYSIKSQLGFLPTGQGYDAVEVMRQPCKLNNGSYFELTGSDAHFPENVGQKAFNIQLPECSFAGLKASLTEYRKS